MDNIKTETVSLKVDDGSSMNAFTAYPDDNQLYPGIILFQEAYGVNGHIKKLAKRIAAEGCIVVAPELFHRTATGFECAYADFNLAEPHFKAITVEGLEGDCRAAYNWLKENAKLKNNKIGCVGFCLGGRVSFLTNTILPVSVSVSFYGGGLPALLNRVNDIHSPHLFFWGGADKHITPEQVEQVVKAMKGSGKPFINVEISYAEHAFFNDERPNYNAKAATEAWAMTLAFFKNNL